MTQLKDYYKTCKNRLQNCLIIVWLLMSLLFFNLSDCIIEYITRLATSGNSVITQDNLLYFKLILDFVLDIIAPTSIVAFLYSRILKYIDEEGWKKKYPEFDISGEWKDTTYYTQYLDNKGLSVINNKSKALSPVIIKQTCRKVEIMNSAGEGFKWYSLLCDWNGDNLDILYAVEYFVTLQQKGYPEKRIGYESMCIDKQGLEQKERPCKMVGKFWHCCSSDGKPVYMGDVVYERSTKE